MRSSFARQAFFLANIRVSNSITGIEWVANAARSSGRPSVASMSFGGSHMDSLNTAVTNLVSSGVTTVAAAGNSNADAVNYSPGGAPSVITVGASDINDSRASFSNYGPVVDVHAPGAYRAMQRLQKLSHLLR